MIRYKWNHQLILGHQTGKCSEQGSPITTIWAIIMFYKFLKPDKVAYAFNIDTWEGRGFDSSLRSVWATKYQVTPT